MSNLMEFAADVESFPTDPTTIDTAHMLLIFSMVVAAKPQKLLELGIGKSYATRALLAGMKFNGAGSLTCVDNLMDFGGIEPPFYTALRDKGVNIIAPITERDFVFSCNEKYDFIMSDADHENSGTWAEMIANLANPGGIMCFHDIGAAYPNSGLVLAMAERRGYSRMLFNANSRPEEHCDRGFLMVKRDR